MISLKQLNYALAVAKTLHFKKAAESCAISPSALSTALTELEKQLGFIIFERDNKRVLVTGLGEQFLIRAREIKTQVDGLYEISQLQRKPLSQPMSLGAIPTIAPYLLPKVLPELREKYPKFKLQIIEEQSHVLVEMVKSGEIDTAILALPFTLEGLLAFEFWQEDFYWVAHREDKDANKTEISSAELAQSKLMLLKDGHCLKDHALAACRLQSNEMAGVLSSTSLNTLVQMVAGKIGTTLVPQMALKQLVSGNSELIAVHLNEPGPHRRIAFITRPAYTGVKDIQVLSELFKQQL